MFGIRRAYLPVTTFVFSSRHPRNDSCAGAETQSSKRIRAAVLRARNPLAASKIRMGVLLSITLWIWLERLGGAGLILLGLADNSVVPLPGSMDALTVILSAHEKTWWPYYAAMATIGA